MSFFRRYVSGVYPLLVWAEDEEDADVVAAIHGATLPPFVVVDICPADAGYRAWLERRAAE
jgi:hypothetical protein